MDTGRNRNKHGQRISRHTGKRLPSKKALHAQIAELEAKLELLKMQLQEHLEVA